MQESFTHWRHIFKLDPDKNLSDSALDKLCRSGTDAFVIGGSSGVTYDNTLALLERIRQYPVVCALEISTDEALVQGFDWYLIPSVLNTARGEWITGRHQQVLAAAEPYMDWSRIAGEGYVILNEQSTAAELTGAVKPDALDEFLAYAALADKLFRLPVFYVEYSGTFGNMNWVRQAKERLTSARLFYGGGIDGPERARQAAEAAHTIVVGNAVYHNLSGALATVEAVRCLDGIPLPACSGGTSL
ncbi:MAG: heptaprenylglyceryl phosphate synthase [Paenibacillaceae bacterium]|jgi:putative glycerol-1-phosphate prenyltransferase|nr:heptaprenylglyceryl phosphate synthase [Paenibacillaceae bacterium]